MKKVKDKFGLITGICLFIASFLPCWKIIGLSEAVIDEKGGLIVLVAAIVAIVASFFGIGLIQMLSGITPLIYLLVFRIDNRMFFSFVNPAFGLFIIIVCCLVLLFSGYLNLPKKKR